MATECGGCGGGALPLDWDDDPPRACFHKRNLGAQRLRACEPPCTRSLTELSLPGTRPGLASRRYRKIKTDQDVKYKGTRERQFEKSTGEFNDWSSSNADVSSSILP